MSGLNHYAAARSMAARRKLLHILARERGLINKDGDSPYRDMLAARCNGKRSGKELTDSELNAAIDHLKGTRATAARPKNANRGELKKIEALLTDAKLPWAYALAILKKHTKGKREALAFATPRELVGVLAALERAALKRLTADLGAELERQGLDWTVARQAAVDAGMSPHADMTKSTEGMSLALRRLRGG